MPNLLTVDSDRANFPLHGGIYDFRTLRCLKKHRVKQIIFASLGLKPPPEKRNMAVKMTKECSSVLIRQFKEPTHSMLGGQWEYNGNIIGGPGSEVVGLNGMPCS